MTAAACAVGRLGPAGPWVGFAPTDEEGYLVVVDDGTGDRSVPAEPDDLLALAIPTSRRLSTNPPRSEPRRTPTSDPWCGRSPRSRRIQCVG